MSTWQLTFSIYTRIFPPSIPTDPTQTTHSLPSKANRRRRSFTHRWPIGSDGEDEGVDRWWKDSVQYNNNNTISAHSFRDGQWRFYPLSSTSSSYQRNRHSELSRSSVVFVVFLFAFFGVLFIWSTKNAGIERDIADNEKFTGFVPEWIFSLSNLQSQCDPASL